MSEGAVKRWCRIFKDGQTNIYTEKWSGQPSVVSDDVFKLLTKNIMKNGISQF
jgi:hypothetical protein